VSLPVPYEVGLSVATEGKFIPAVIPLQYPRKLRNLVCLPDDYTELINMVSNFTCKNSTSVDSRVPTMCLICGEILCSQVRVTLTDLKIQFGTYLKFPGVMSKLELLLSERAKKNLSWPVHLPCKLLWGRLWCFFKNSRL